MFPAVLIVVGIVCITVGAAMFSVAASLIVLGLILTSAGYEMVK